MQVITTGDVGVSRGESSEAAFRFESARAPDAEPSRAGCSADLHQQSDACILILRRLGPGKGGGVLRLAAPSSPRELFIETDAGAVTARSSSGGIDVGSAKAALCESVSGGIRLRNISTRVRAPAVPGDLDVTLARDARLESSTLSSAAGDITVTLPSNLAVMVKALSEPVSWNARVLSEFPTVGLQSRPGAGQRAVAGGTLNGGGPLLVLTTSRGSIDLKRLR